MSSSLTDSLVVSAEHWSRAWSSLVTVNLNFCTDHRSRFRRDRQDNVQGRGSRSRFVGVSTPFPSRSSFRVAHPASWPSFCPPAQTTTMMCHLKAGAVHTFKLRCPRASIQQACASRPFVSSHQLLQRSYTDDATVPAAPHFLASSLVPPGNAHRVSCPRTTSFSPRWSRSHASRLAATRTRREQGRRSGGWRVSPKRSKEGACRHDG